MRRGALVQLSLLALLAGAAGLTLALVPGWLPESAAKEADRIHFVFWFVTGICIFIFAIVAAAMAYSILRFRARPDDLEDGPPIHGHTGLEIAWTVVPAVLVTAMGVISAVVLSRNDAAGASPLRIHVIAQQFAWSFKYPKEAGGQTSAILRLPLGRSVLLDLDARDVIHSFWVPEFSQKQDAVPGLHPTLHITPKRLGTFPVICTELCGLGHALMRSTVIVMPVRAFDRWAKGQQKAAAAPPAQQGLTLFKENGCSSCHTLKAAGATQKTGPDLDKLPQYARQAKQPLDAFIRDSIRDPNAYIQPGYPKNVMPPFTSLSSSQLDALVKFLITSSTKG